MRNLAYLELLAAQYPTERAVLGEMLRLEAVQRLPKGTELFLSDVHGEDEAFTHLINNASGIIEEKIEKALPDLPEKERQALSSLISYPHEQLLGLGDGARAEEWDKLLRYLVAVAREAAAKYSVSQLRAALPDEHSYVLEELISCQDRENRAPYLSGIISAAIGMGEAPGLIRALSGLIKRLAVARLHLVGDVYDRGPHADVIMDALMNHHSVDVQWGNHDLLWMGAAAGSPACVACAVRNVIQYDNLDMLENGYGINLLPLALFANRTYEGDEAAAFAPRALPEALYLPQDPQLYARMHKAIAVILFKLEGQLVRRRPEYLMEDRDMLSRVDWDSFTLDGHALNDRHFPTVNKRDPLELTDGEYALIGQLVDAFRRSEKLQQHARFFYRAGGMYLRFNGNLLYHGCVPLNPDGSFMALDFEGQKLEGRELFDYCDRMAREGYFAPENSARRKEGRDFLWFLWCGRNAPSFGRSHMSTFERLLIEDESTWKEGRNAYYDYYGEESFAREVLRRFDCDKPWGRIINGHVPVKAKKGEDPRKAGGRLIVIDGGFCRAYQKSTGTAGYTMFFSSHGIRIAAHEPFTSRAEAISGNLDVRRHNLIIENLPERLLVQDTDEGEKIAWRIKDLEQLAQAYRAGQIRQSGAGTGA